MSATILHDYKIPIGPVDYTILEVHDLKELAENNEEIELMGMYNVGKAEIFINSDLPFQQKLATLLHEIGHVIAHQAGQTVEEGILDAFAYAYTGIIPKIARLWDYKDGD